MLGRLRGVKRCTDGPAAPNYWNCVVSAVGPAVMLRPIGADVSDGVTRTVVAMKVTTGVDAACPQDDTWLSG